MIKILKDALTILRQIKYRQMLKNRSTDEVIETHKNFKLGVKETKDETN